MQIFKFKGSGVFFNTKTVYVCAMRKHSVNTPDRQLCVFQNLHRKVLNYVLQPKYPPASSTKTSFIKCKNRHFYIFYFFKFLYFLNTLYSNLSRIPHEQLCKIYKCHIKLYIGNFLFRKNEKIAFLYFLRAYDWSLERQEKVTLPGIIEKGELTPSRCSPVSMTPGSLLLSGPRHDRQ